ncbi:MAG TPA: glycosyltransferase [Myxococcota bacterium]|nr:glycosyltransferase [Myxococcota bacterium]
MRVALVHDWLTGFRGGEKVLHELARMFPQADLYTLIRVPGSVSPEIERLHIHVSPLSSLPGAARHYRKLLPLFPWAIERFQLHGYDLVISTSHSFAKGVRVAPGTPHLCYCFTPIRYAWDLADEYLGRGAKRLVAAPLLSYLRRWDRRTSSPARVTQVVAISRTIADRVRRVWGREASVVFPGVDVARFARREPRPGEFFFMLGGFVPYKAEALAIEAFRRTGQSLVLAGDGPTRAALEKMAPPNVRFLGRVSDTELEDLYARCRALVYPQLEDFGIIAVEAQAAGKPVIALGKGGAAETVVGPNDPEGRAPTGLFFAEPTPESLERALRAFDELEPKLEPQAIRAHAARFSLENFRAGIAREIEKVLR